MPNYTWLTCTYAKLWKSVFRSLIWVKLKQWLKNLEIYHYLRKIKIMVSNPYRWYKENKYYWTHRFYIIFQLGTSAPGWRLGFRKGQQKKIPKTNPIKVITFFKTSKWNISSKSLSTVPFLMSGCSESINGPSCNKMQLSTSSSLQSHELAIIVYDPKINQ